MKPHTFNDGTTVPAGTLLLIAIDATNQDSEHYANAGEFRPFRFVGADAPESHNAGQPFSAVSLDFRAYRSPCVTAPDVIELTVSWQYPSDTGSTRALADSSQTPSSS